MADDSMARIELAEKDQGSDFLRELGQYTLQRLMELEVEAQVGAGKHERTDERTAQRNGYRDRGLETRLGSMALRIPKLRAGRYYPSFLEPRRMSEHAVRSPSAGRAAGKSSASTAVRPRRRPSGPSS